jgi:FHA domain
MNKPALTFCIFQGSTFVRRETVRQDIVKIGKDPKSHLLVDCELAARMHAVLEVGGASDLTLIDLGNEPGTMVNGQRINKCHLKVGDRVQIGTSTFELESAVDAAEQVAFAPAPAAPQAPAALFNAPMFAPLAPHNPFMVPSALAQVPPSPVLAVEQLEGDEGYAMIKSGPAPHAEEVELTHVSAVEVLVKWETNVLHVAHLSPIRSFFVGERDGKGEACDFLLPADVLGATRFPIVVERAGGAWLVVPRGATGSVAMPNEASMPVGDLVASGRARPSLEVSGAHEIELLPGTRAKIALPNSEIAFEVNAVNAGRKVATGLLASLEANAYRGVAMSLFAHLGIVASLAFFMPRMAADDAEGIDRDFMARMLHASDANAVIEEAKLEDQATANDQASGGEGKRAQNEEGQMGKDTAQPANKHWSVAGPADNADPKLARDKALREAADWGMIGLLAMDHGAVNAPTAIWGEDKALGKDPANHLGQMWGAEAGDAWGIGGLGLTGTGDGGGGPYQGIGLGKIGTMGHGDGCVATPGHPCGIAFGPGGEGIGHGGKLPHDHTPKALPLRESKVDVNGRLPAEVIQRIVRQNFGRFRNCYESALRTNPSLTGRVAVKFVIGRDGGVTMASDGGSDLPDQNVVQCVTRGFQNLSFPSPEGGIVTVVYPLVFSAQN